MTGGGGKKNPEENGSIYWMCKPVDFIEKATHPYGRVSPSKDVIMIYTFFVTLKC